MYGGLDPVDRTLVVRHWLRQEMTKAGNERAVGEMNERELIDTLLERTNGHNSILWKEGRVDWYYTRLDEAQFRRLRLIESPEELGWNLLADDQSVLSCAENVRSGDVDADVTDIVDIEHIRRLHAELPDAEVEDIILKTETSTSPPRVVDGNHRAVAVAMHLLETGEFPEIDAFVGVKRVSVARTAYEKARWWLRNALSSGQFL